MQTREVDYGYTTPEEWVRPYNGDSPIRRFYDGGDPAPAPAPEPAAIPEFSKLVETLPEDIRGHSSLAKVTSFDGLVNSYISAQKMIGKDPNSFVELPLERNAETRLPVLQKLGLPENAEGYKLEAGEGTPEFLAPNTELAKTFVAAAHKVGVFPDQAQALYNAVAAPLAAAAAAQATAADEAFAANEAALKTELGDAYDQTIRAASFAADKLGIFKELEDAGLGTSPAVVKALAKVGELLNEDDASEGKGGGKPFGSARSPQQLREEANDITKQLLTETNPVRRRELAAKAAELRGKIPQGS